MEIGLQLYSVRDKMEENMEETLKAVSKMGYTFVEFAGYFGKSAEEIKEMLNKYNLNAISVHQKHNVFLEENKMEYVNFLKVLGVKYCAIPWTDKRRFIGDEFNKLISEIKEVSRLLKDNGISLLYHNHDFEFQIKKGDKYVIDAMYDELKEDVLMPELDLCWVNYAGEDPIFYVNKYKDREDIIHIKDFTCDKLCCGPQYALIDENGKDDTKEKRKENNFHFKPIGQGRLDSEGVLSAINNTEIKYVIVEQDGHDDNDSLEDAKKSIDYIRSLGY